MPRKKTEPTEQLNFSATPTSTADRFRDFKYKFKKLKNPKATDSQVGALTLEAGMDSLEREFETEIKNKK